MQTRSDITRILRENQADLAALYGVSKIGLFGSYARATARKASDVDLLIEFDRPIGLKFIDLAEYLETLLGVKVDLLTPAGLESIRIPEITERILADLVEV